ncbi:MAG: DUF4386 domain-containing protein [Bacteroidota bacterium]|nr:DUF4386 domain-containing protein [Bacteroidota bacterium]
MNSSSSRPALIAGWSIILMAVAAGFAYGYVWPLFQEGPQSLDWIGKQQQKTLFFASIGAWLLILILDVIVSIAVYQFFRRLNQRIAAFTAATRLLYSFFLILGIIDLINGAEALEVSDGSSIFRSSLAGFEYYWSLGLIAFGFHLAGLGWLVSRPKWLKFLLYIAAIGYLLVHGGSALFPSKEETIGSMEAILSIPMAAGELILAFFFLLRPEKLRTQNGMK